MNPMADARCLPVSTEGAFAKVLAADLDAMRAKLFELNRLRHALVHANALLERDNDFLRQRCRELEWEARMEEARKVDYEEVARAIHADLKAAAPDLARVWEREHPWLSGKGEPCEES